MTRFSFILFNLLVVAVVYLIVYLNGAKPAVVGYTLRNFSEPYIALMLLMIVISTVRWFMHHDPEVGREVTTWVLSLIALPLATTLALYLLGGMDHEHFGASLRSLMNIR